MSVLDRFRRRRRSLADLVAQRDQLVAELAVLDEDAAWAAASDEQEELADAHSLRRQADALRRSIADIDREIAAHVEGDAS